MMRGRKAVRPLAEVADAAVTAFTDKGFRAAGISDVAAAMGLSHGALYTYAESKRALLYLALLRTLRPEAVDALTIPVTAPPPDDFVALLTSWVARHGIPPVLDPAGHRDVRPAQEELGAIIDALYDIIEHNRLALQLIERCAADLPEVAQWYFVQRRRATLERISEFLRTRIESGELRPVPDAPTAARYINETIAWFAMHRHGDPDSAMLDDDTCRRTVRHLLLASFPAAPSSGAPSSGAPSSGAPSSGESRYNSTLSP